MSSLYDLLGLEKGASAEDIKKAYRKSALVNHPDRGGDKETFQKMQGAYDVLSDQQKRAYYDATGQISSESGPDPGPGPGQNIDLSSIFGSMFGSGFPGFGFPGQRGSPNIRISQGPNKIHEIGLSLSDLYNGKSFKINMKREVICTACASKNKPCDACGGKGMRVRAQQMGPIMAMTQEPCAPCNQSGQRIVEDCESCKNRRVVERESFLDVRIEPGMQDGDRLTFAGQCSESPLFQKPGDLILIIRAIEPESAQWVRQGADLSYALEISLAESLLGWERRLEGHPSGREIHIVRSAGVIRHGDVLSIPDWGMPVQRSAGKGSLKIVCSVGRNQDRWSEEQQSVLKSVWPEWMDPVLTESSVSV